MKARPVKSPDRLLICGFDGEEEKIFGKCALKLNEELIAIPEGSGAQKVGYLAGLGGYTDSGERLAVTDKCVIFAMDMKKLGKTVDEMNKNGLGGIPLKAALTPINRDMTLSELISELKKEHKAMHKEDT